jgi:hypothetical protein
MRVRPIHSHCQVTNAQLLILITISKSPFDRVKQFNPFFQMKKKMSQKNPGSLFHEQHEAHEVLISLLSPRGPIRGKGDPFLDKVSKIAK